MARSDGGVVRAGDEGRHGGCRVQRIRISQLPVRRDVLDDCAGCHRLR